MGNGMQVRITMRSNSSAMAFVGKRLVGVATAWNDSNEDFVILKSEVRPQYRRRGIATMLYRSIEEASGKQLKPAVSLSDDAFAFWKSYRPASVAHDLRHQPELIGMPVQKNGRPGRIIRASGRIAEIEYDDGNSALGIRSHIHSRDLGSHLMQKQGSKETMQAAIG